MSRPTKVLSSRYLVEQVRRHLPARGVRSRPERRFPCALDRAARQALPSPPSRGGRARLAHLVKSTDRSRAASPETGSAVGTTGNTKAATDGRPLYTATLGLYFARFSALSMSRANLVARSAIS